jgi:antitoxin YefM
MITAIREHTVIKNGGQIEIPLTDLPDGTEVEVIVLVEGEEVDTTEYLLSTAANREHLEQALRDANDPTKRIHVDVADL